MDPSSSVPPFESSMRSIATKTTQLMRTLLHRVEVLQAEVRTLKSEVATLSAALQASASSTASRSSPFFPQTTSSDTEEQDAVQKETGTSMSTTQQAAKENTTTCIHGRLNEHYCGLCLYGFEEVCNPVYGMSHPLLAHK